MVSGDATFSMHAWEARTPSLFPGLHHLQCLIPSTVQTWMGETWEWGSLGRYCQRLEAGVFTGSISQLVFEDTGDCSTQNYNGRTLVCPRSVYPMSMCVMRPAKLEYWKWSMAWELGKSLTISPQISPIHVCTVEAIRHCRWWRPGKRLGVLVSHACIEKVALPDTINH